MTRTDKSTQANGVFMSFKVSTMTKFYKSAMIYVKKIPWIFFFFLKLYRPYRHVERLLKQSGLPKKQIEKKIDAALDFVLIDIGETSSGIHRFASVSDIKGVNRIHMIVNILYWIRAESKSNHATNLLLTNEINRINNEIQAYGSAEQCSVSANHHYLIEGIIENYQPYAEFDLNNKSSIQVFDLDLEKESIEVLLNHRTDCLIAHGSATLH